MTQVIIGRSGRGAERLMSIAAEAFGTDHGARLSARATVASRDNGIPSAAPSLGLKPGV